TATVESNTGNDISSYTNTVTSADVAVVKTGPAGAVAAGTTITYTLAYRNLGTAAAQGVNVVDTLPAGLSFVAASGGGFDAVSRRITFAAGVLLAHDGGPAGPADGSA